MKLTAAKRGVGAAVRRVGRSRLMVFLGLTNDIISAEQYSYLVIVVIGTAVIPTLIASLAFVPKHLLPARETPPMALPEEMPEQLLAAVHDQMDLEIEEAEEIEQEG